MMQKATHERLQQLTAAETQKATALAPDYSGAKGDGPGSRPLLAIATNACAILVEQMRSASPFQLNDAGACNCAPGVNPHISTMVEQKATSERLQQLTAAVKQ